VKSVVFVSEGTVTINSALPFTLESIFILPARLIFKSYSKSMFAKFAFKESLCAVPSGIKYILPEQFQLQVQNKIVQQ
tara:strand:- start:438 stop:671 length:234 start_codon:yes stop_codon:yes gene_type:complete